MRSIVTLALSAVLLGAAAHAAEPGTGDRHSMEGRVPASSGGADGSAPATTGTGVSREGGTAANRWGVGGVTGGASGAADEIDRGRGVTQGGTSQTAASSGLGLGNLDANGDNRLSRDEVKADANLQQRFGALDTNRDGFLSAEEFARHSNGSGAAGQQGGMRGP